MAALTRQLALGHVLTPPSRQRLIGWMRASKTGLNRLRKGLPVDWTAGDKTGTGARGATNDIAVAWPPHSRPLVIAAYYQREGRSMDENAAVLAEVGRVVAAMA